MGTHLQTLIEYQNQGGLMPPTQAQRCRWLSRSNHGERLKTNRDGWPYHPILKIDLKGTTKTPNNIETTQVTLKWYQEGKGEEQLIENQVYSLQNLLLWPGGNTFDSTTRFVTGKKMDSRVTPIERLHTFKVIQDLIEKEIGIGTLDVIRKLKGIKKYSAIGFLFSNLPQEKTQRDESIKRRNQFIKRNPELTHWMWNKRGVWKIKGDFTSQPKSEWLETLHKLIDSGASDKEITFAFTGTDAWKPQQLHQIAKVIQGNKIQCDHWIDILEDRRRYIQEILVSSHDPEKASEWIKLQNQRLIDNLQKTNEGKISRNKPPTSTDRWYSNYHSKSEEEKKSEFLRGDAFLQNWTIWQALNTWKKTKATLEKAEAKKPPEKQHRILIPDNDHILDYLYETYEERPIPTNLSPKKLIEGIRKWESNRLELIEKELKKSDVHIPKSILEKYPKTLEGKNFRGQLLTSKHDYENESKDQGHCVRGYFKEAEKGKIAVYKITTDSGKRWTLEVNSDMTMVQLKGFKNAIPPEALESKIEETLEDISQEKDQVGFKNLTSNEKITIRKIRRAGMSIIPKENTEEKAQTWKEENRGYETQIDTLVEAAKPKNRYVVLSAEGPYVCELNDNTVEFYKLKGNTNEIVPAGDILTRITSRNSRSQIHVTFGNTDFALSITKTGKILLEYEQNGENYSEIIEGGKHPELAILTAELEGIDPEKLENTKICIATTLVKNQIGDILLEKNKKQEQIYFHADSKEEARSFCENQKKSKALIKTPISRYEARSLKKSEEEDQIKFQEAQSQGKILIRLQRNIVDPEKMDIWEKILEAAKHLEENEIDVQRGKNSLELIQEGQTRNAETKIACKPPIPNKNGPTPELVWLNSTFMLPQTEKEKAPKRAPHDLTELRLTLPVYI